MINMTWDDFRDAATALLELQDQLRVTKHPVTKQWNWTWESAPTTTRLLHIYPGYGFLASRNNIRRYQPQPFEDSSAAADDEDVIDDVDPGLLEQPMDPCMFSYEFHIVYSPIYRLPVLFLQGSHLDGTPLTTSQVQAHLSQQFIDGTKFVSQDEHPVLGVPFYFVHPCETSACLSLLLENQAIPCPLQVLLSWMSLLAPWSAIPVHLPQPPSDIETASIAGVM
ncbi:unnamed protein product [Aphanomyces euteiches]|uniref:Ubiquitin-like-conjugating enzyme ATG10 n=1 Tax=Aphanomyces euteiches TaxID=100861 RepID=A0A6G0X972_9STRA|nr:hypothetical protein Ae201684_007512 [Aphanomyces euteiches]KAH9132048.1 hypothetical protein AeRB84_021410 [Aphanomyces euteiches]